MLAYPLYVLYVYAFMQVVHIKSNFLSSAQPYFTNFFFFAWILLLLMNVTSPSLTWQFPNFKVPRGEAGNRRLHSSSHATVCHRRRAQPSCLPWGHDNMHSDCRKLTQFSSYCRALHPWELCYSNLKLPKMQRHAVILSETFKTFQKGSNVQCTPE